VVAARKIVSMRRQNFANPLFYVQFIVILMLAVMVIYPAGILLNESVRGPGGEFTLRWFEQAYLSARNFRALTNTLIIATGAALVATIFGSALAWVVVRTNVPGRKIIQIGAIIPFILTSFVGALAWILLAAPKVGLINQLWTYLGGSGELLDIYSRGGIILIGATHDIPLVFLLVAGALRSMDPSLEEASMGSGASLWHTTTRVTLPLVTPAILSSALLIFVLAAEQFGVPAVLGSPSGIRVLTTAIIEAQAVYPPRRGLGAALCVTLLVLALLGLWLQRKVTGARSYHTVSGKSTQPREVDLGTARWVVFGVCIVYLLVTIVLPIATLFISSIRTVWTSDFRWEQFTLQNYYWVLFEYPITRRAITNSLFLGVVGATLGMLLCAVISFLILRTNLAGRKLLDYLSMLPLGFPGVVLAYGLLQAWITPPLVLYGTIWILLVAYITRDLPLGVRATSSILTQIHPELEESSLSCGASWFQTFRNITLPLLKPGIIAGWIILFVSFTRELSASMLLYSPRHEVISVAIYDMHYDGNFRALSALSFLQIMLALGMLGLSQLLTAKRKLSS
jgi:iron(III) transport system permease protein